MWIIVRGCPWPWKYFNTKIITPKFPNTKISQITVYMPIVWYCIVQTYITSCHIHWIRWDLNSFASVVHLYLQEGFTAILKAALKGHLTVLQTLVEQYGGNVLHRNKVRCCDKWFQCWRHICIKFVGGQPSPEPRPYSLHHYYCTKLCNEIRVLFQD